MLYLTCTTITSVDLAHYGVYLVKDWVSVNCGTMSVVLHIKNQDKRVTDGVSYWLLEVPTGIPRTPPDD